MVKNTAIAKGFTNTNNTELRTEKKTIINKQQQTSKTKWRQRRSEKKKTTYCPATVRTRGPV
jgi:hypothetical protein